MSKVTIWHNPSCGTSRNTLALLRERGIEPEVIQYMKTPTDRDALKQVIKTTGEPVRALLRSKEKLCAELGLDEEATSDDELLDAMLAHPVLINRPVVITAKGARLCRPPEKALEILPAA